MVALMLIVQGSACRGSVVFLCDAAPHPKSGPMAISGDAVPTTRHRGGTVACRGGKRAPTKATFRRGGCSLTTESRHLAPSSVSGKCKESGVALSAAESLSGTARRTRASHAKVAVERCDILPVAAWLPSFRRRIGHRQVNESGQYGANESAIRRLSDYSIARFRSSFTLNVDEVSSAIATKPGGCWFPIRRTRSQS